MWKMLYGKCFKGYVVQMLNQSETCTENLPQTHVAVETAKMYCGNQAACSVHAVLVILLSLRKEHKRWRTT